MLVQHHNDWSKRHLLVTSVAAICLAMFGHVDSATAATVTSVGSGGGWNTPGTWDNGVPRAGDDVIIDEGCTVTVAIGTAEVNSIVIRDSAVPHRTPGRLHLLSGAVLKVRSSIDVEDSQAAPGEFYSVDATGTTPIVGACNNGTPVTVTLDGLFACSGTLGLTFDGEGAGDDFRLLHGGTIRAFGGTITIAAPFENDGTVWADGGTIEFTSTLGAASSGLFKVTSGSLIFNLSAAATINTGADFLVAGGLMHFKEDVETDGGYQQTGGQAKADAGTTFKATGAY